MGLARFLTDLFADGNVRVATDPRTADDDRRAAAVVLVAEERRLRADAPGTAPEFRPDVALAAAEWFARACWGTAFRHADADMVRGLLAWTAPPAPVAARHWSADVVLRFLPDLWRMARGLAPDDPLVAEILRTAAEWPVSSVGIAGLPPETVAARVAEIDFAANPCLGRICADRIVATGDASRLAVPELRELVGAALGAYPDLAPALASVAGTEADIA